MSPPLICFVGSTATGKSSLAVRLAQGLIAEGRPAEIINADSMLVYRGMDIGTAKPSVEERKGITHHLIDIMDVSEPNSVGIFQPLARRAIAEVRGRGAIPILVGGSALYLHAIIDRFEFPSTDPNVRSRLSEQADAIGPQAMYERLQEISPDAARGIHPADIRRVIRALEAIEVNGDFTSALPQWEYAIDNIVQVGLAMEREDMDRRIGIRVDEMWNHGLVDEVEGLLAHGLREGPTAAKAIGYHQAIAYIDGQMTKDEAIESTALRTRQFARRQLSWWRRDPRILWIDANNVPLAKIVEVLNGDQPLWTTLGNVVGGQSIESA